MLTRGTIFIGLLCLLASGSAFADQIPPTPQQALSAAIEHEKLNLAVVMGVNRDIAPLCHDTPGLARLCKEGRLFVGMLDQLIGQIVESRGLLMFVSVVPEIESNIVEMENQLAIFMDIVGRLSPIRAAPLPTRFSP